MTKRSKPGIGKIRHMGLGVIERDGLNGTCSRGLHQGPRSCAPHREAGHMSAPTNSSEQPKHLAKQGPSTPWKTHHDLVERIMDLYGFLQELHIPDLPTLVCDTVCSEAGQGSERLCFDHCLPPQTPR